MKTLPVGEFKTHFSAILDCIKNGEEIAFLYGKGKEKIVVLVPYGKYSIKRKRNLGLLQNKASFTAQDINPTDNTKNHS
ncbi:MAG: type II toxin-antitoxin system Phd/YefM family antitoxin [Spirochaetes bacterium]|nr:type II toxin-antitoxin system Phd/YefM family antitoxin [Spirochaetota bacterium]MBN2770124.1 type II toxin-antitoxin system Phd/YefM family antitoxin [Spirochaetota bacterium]